MLFVSFFMSLPVLVKVLSSLCLIVVSNRLLKRLSLSVALGTLVLALWLGHSPSAMLRIAGSSVLNRENLMLMVIVLEAIWLSSQMSTTGVMQDLVGVVRSRTSQRVSIASLPALVGSLPMPAGAIFSAPMVESCDEEGRLSPLTKVQINYWFRHMWEYWWPLYPGVLLAIQIAHVEVWQFLLTQIPLTLIHLGLGYVLLLRPIPGGGVCQADRGGSESPRMISLVFPIVIVISCFVLLTFVIPAASSFSKYLPMAVGLCLAMVALQKKRPLDRSAWKKILLSKSTFTLAALVMIIRVYGAFIESRLPDGTPLVDLMRQELAGWGVPQVAMIMALPFVAGFTTGLTVGFVGASFPIVVNLVGLDAPVGARLAAVALAYGCGYAGMMQSPMHLCIIVTNHHFKTRLIDSLRAVLKLTAGLMAGSVILYLALRALFV